MAQKNKGGRPKKIIDYEIVEKLAKLFCTQEEIASRLSNNDESISVRTLQRDAKFCHVYKRGIDSVRRSLRTIQLKQAHDGNSTMAIWLGKQYLGQKDKQEIDNKSSDGSMSPFKIVFINKKYKD